MKYVDNGLITVAALVAMKLLAKYVVEPRWGDDLDRFADWITRRNR